MSKVLYFGLFSGLFSVVFLILGLLVSVAFYSLLERKVLSYIQFRKGPNKVGFIGIVQSFSDAIKLLSKGLMVLEKYNIFIYYLVPLFMFIISVLIWVVFPYMGGMFLFSLGFLFIICLLSLGVYMLIFSGWSSNSVYSMLGGLRGVIQSISYEVSLVITMFFGFIYVGGFDISVFFFFQVYGNWFMLMVFPLVCILLISMMAEVNRTPFDFAEGESELVSGFNLEYSGVGFVMLFMSEYMAILFMSFFFVILFMGGDYYSLIFFIKLFFVSFFFVWVRGSFPRYRYDKLMMLTWKIFLPVSLSFFMFNWGVYLFVCWNFFG
uniref:NADH-ubiquinone oxidoreductase chain 1 n=1 Tax=Pseudoneureclipsis sibuyana TaxID=2904893 RepID=A0A9E8RUX7_9NEOP|nr:NADH dehydrogenase subunit 1 [Pseudoneureclipsis sibuyana]UZZ44298.1 NADH dehydrogenase subunit 1 [Pseudoneureclipsis sibuyana]